MRILQKKNNTIIVYIKSTIPQAQRNSLLFLLILNSVNGSTHHADHLQIGW